MRSALRAATVICAMCGVVLPASVNAENQCKYLRVTLSANSNYHFSAAFASRGNVISVTPDSVLLRQSSDLYGPDAYIEVMKDGFARWEYASGFNVKQKFCFWKSGEITLTPEGDPRPVYTITRGDYSDSRAGEITITGFNPP